MVNLAAFYNLQDRPDLASYGREQAEATSYRPGGDNTGLPADVQSSFADKGLPRESGPK
jgi:hypothetical protein